MDVTISYCTFSSNNSTGLLAIEANLYFEDSVAFRNNTGGRGGLSLINSYMIVTPNTRLQFINNHAEQLGGAIYVKQDSLTCFVQPRVHFSTNSVTEIWVAIVQSKLAVICIVDT